MGRKGHIMPCPVEKLPPENGGSPSSLEDTHKPHKKVVRYMECLRNHAAAIGGNAIDGCGEFMPSGEEGTLEALKCSACNCHRNFHRKEIQCDCPFECYHTPFLHSGTAKLILGPSNYLVESSQGYPTGTLISSGKDPVQQTTTRPCKSGSVPSESDEKIDGGGFAARPSERATKRFRTKFTPEQKDKMLTFAEKVGWRIKKLEDSLVQQFCQEVGVKRRVLKVWMHNNKHSLAKKSDPST